MTPRMSGSIKRTAVCLVWGFACVLLYTHAVCAGGGPDNVLVVRNTQSKTSSDIAGYYTRARSIPSGNICVITCSTDEIVSKSEYEINIAAPIRSFLQKPELADRIDYIVVTKGLPLSVNMGWGSGCASLTSLLTCLSETSVTAPIVNPYGPTALTQVETAFSHQLSLAGRHLYLVTRLDATTVEDVYSMIDGSVSASSAGQVALDARSLPTNSPYYTMNDRIIKARDLLEAKGVPCFYDGTTAFVGGLTGLIGYFSWGSNDPYYAFQAYTSNTFLPGSIADTYVSSSGRTFDTTAGGQSLIVDLVPQGVCGILGYVSEPYTLYSTHPNVLFDRYTKGYNMAESFYAATPELFWKSVVAGDPLMAAFATPPVVSIDNTGQPITGQAAVISATATDVSGVSKVDFYFDSKYIGTDTQPPFSVVHDTTQHTVGLHTVKAIAYENSPIATRGSSASEITVQNPISKLNMISDAFPSPDGQGVSVPSKVVTAGTMDMGGSEFYLQDEDRSGGIRVVSTQPVQEGDLVSVLGDLVTVSGEKSINATSITVENHLLSPLQPVFMRTVDIGGSSVNDQTKGVSGGIGARNLGLLIKAIGKVTYSGSEGEDFFYIDDGCRLDDGSGHIGLKVKSRSFSKPSIGAVIAVTGLSSCEQVAEKTNRVLKIRRQNDIAIIRS